VLSAFPKVYVFRQGGNDIYLFIAVVQVRNYRWSWLLSEEKVVFRQGWGNIYLFIVVVQVKNYWCSWLLSEVSHSGMPYQVKG
jgi:hypothetical protein